MTLVVTLTLWHINECDGKDVHRHKPSKAASLNVISRTDAKKHSRETMPKTIRLSESEKKICDIYCFSSFLSLSLGVN